MMYYVRCPDGSRYKVREAVSLQDAINEISMARVSGSVGSRTCKSDVIIGRPINEWPTTVIADVVRVNSDNTEQKSYTEIY